MLRQGLCINNSTSVMQSQLAEENKVTQDVPIGRINYYDLWIADELNEGTASTTMLGSYDDEQVVIKKYKVDSLNPRLANLKMLKEWEILHASFPSQYIVRPVGYCQKPPLLVMEYVKYGSLETYLSYQKPLTWKQKISIANDVALGILKLLEIGIIHRDIKPGNILITKSLRAKLCDFDLSRKVNSTEPLEIGGTYEYLAPEYSLPSISNIFLPAADAFSFGVTLFQLCTNEEIFSAYSDVCDGNINTYTNAQEKVQKLNEIIHDSSKHWPKGLNSIMTDCLNLQPEKRPTMYHIQEKLSQLLVDITKDKKCILISPLSMLSPKNKTIQNEIKKVESNTKIAPKRTLY